MTKRTAAYICCFGVIAAAVLLLRSLVHTDNDVGARSESGTAKAVEYENADARPIPSEGEASMSAELRRTAFVVRRSDNVLLSAAGQCSRGQVYARVTANVPFRSLPATVIDIRASGRVPRDYEFFVDAVRGEVIEGHFDAGDHCTLRLVGSRGPTDPVPVKNPGNV